MKMDTYYLNTLICFFRSQLDLDFVAIRDVLNIVDDELTPDNEKRDMIMATLRGYGLNECSYRHGRFSPAEDRSPAEYDSDKVHNVISYPLHPIRFPVLNGTITVNIPLN